MKVAALISGGVDSAVAVHQLLEQGHQVYPFYIRIGRDDDSGDCSADEDIEMCQLITRRYNLPLEVVSLHQEYWENVMEYALKSVRKGLTPNPDMMCNKMIKFGYFERNWGHEFDVTATGHYATIHTIDGLKYLGTAPDPVKDQTDFLAQITYEQLDHLMFPIGDMPKHRVREIAIETKMPNAYRKDSQGICFLGKINYNDFLRRHLGEMKGPIIDIETGKKLGEHNGFWYHTIGQRKGLGLSGGPWYVVDKDVNENIIYVANGYDAELQYGRQIPITQMHWITRDPWQGQECKDVEITFKNRHMPQFVEGRLTRLPSNAPLIKNLGSNDIQIGTDGTVSGAHNEIKGANKIGENSVKSSSDTSSNHNQNSQPTSSTHSTTVSAAPAPTAPTAPTDNLIVEDKRYVIESSAPIQGVAPGQFAVIYDRESRLCLGSGVITFTNQNN